MRILVVEDQELNIDMLVRRLVRRGASVDVARDGETAISKVAVENYDVLLLDICLPGISGLEVATRMKADDRTRAMPIIALTANARESGSTHAIAAGCDAYVTKPIDFEGLVAQILRLVPPETKVASIQTIH